jgi:hypothetical protein
LLGQHLGLDGGVPSGDQPQDQASRVDEGGLRVGQAQSMRCATWSLIGTFSALAAAELSGDTRDTVAGPASTGTPDSSFRRHYYSPAVRIYLSIIVTILITSAVMVGMGAWLRRR